MELALEDEFVEQDHAQSILSAAGGYGNGSRIVARKMGQIKRACESTHKTCVYLAQSQVSEQKSPDMEPYHILAPKLSKHALPYFVDHVDCVAFLRLKAQDKRQSQQKIIVSSQERELVCHASLTTMSKNRFGIESPLSCPKNHNPLEKYLNAN